MTIATRCRYESPPSNALSAPNRVFTATGVSGRDQRLRVDPAGIRAEGRAVRLSQGSDPKLRSGCKPQPNTPTAAETGAICGADGVGL